MIRKVAFRRAVLAGAAGAVAWELLARALIAAGLPLFDLVFMLGTLALGPGPAWQWWTAGLALHALVGAIWATFYAYFAWSTFDWPPVLQGVAFAVAVAATLAGLVMVPQMGLMHPLVARGAMPEPGLFAARLGWGGPAAVVVGHLVYGLVLGALYTHPVGTPVRRRPRQRRAVDA